MSKVRVGINGFGRIGRILFRAGFDKLDIVGINNTADPGSTCHLLKYDSTHGRYNRKVQCEENAITVDGKRIPLAYTRNPEDIPWKEWEVDVVLECTGAFKKAEDFQKHIKAGAKKVLVSAPAPGADMTIVYGVNHQSYDPKKHNVVSNASCTTNCLAPVAKVLHETFEIEQGLMTTVHSYTNDQNVLDAGHKDLRRARAAALSMIPTTTGAAAAVGLVLPELKGKLNGLAVRVPTPNVSMVDLVIQTKKEVSVDAINNTLLAASDGSMKGILDCSDEPLVSCDFNGNPFSSIADLTNTMVSGDHMAKIFAWYDNEMGFSHRMVDMALYMHQQGY